MKKYTLSADKTPRSGFTLLELMVVIIIIVGLMAILVPNVLSYRSRTNIRQAELQIGNFGNALEDYASEYGKYPTTEQGLKALIFVPANEAVGIQTGFAGMQNGTGLTAGGDPNSMLGGAAAVGTGMDMTGNMMQPAGVPQPGMTDPSGMNGMAGAVGTGMQPGMMQPGMTAPTGMGMTDPMAMNGMAGAVGTGMTDPMAMNGMGQAGMAGTNTFGLGMSNPNLYTAMKKRATPFINREDVLVDPWKNPYRYDNSMTATGVNPFTGEKKPAIWSAGPDEKDGTEDDIRNWKPEVAQRQLLNSQQTGMGMGMTQPGMSDPNVMTGMTDPNMMNANPMNPNPMGGMPMQPNMPNMMTPNPMGGMPMQPNMPNTMTPNPMGGMPAQPMPAVPQ